MTAILLKQKILSDHNKLIEQLEEKYNDRISQLLKQKMIIIVELQNALFQQFEYVDYYNNENDHEEILIDSSESTNDNDCDYNTETKRENEDPIFSLKDTDPNDFIVSERKPNHSNGSRGSKFECIVCHRSLSSKRSLQRHMKIHTEEKPFKCNHCNYACRSAYTLREHIRIHTGEKPFKCSYCDFRCRIKHGLKNHIRIHTGETPYKCNDCGKKFRTSNQCRTHKRIHTGEKAYKCSKCKERFETRSKRRMHLKNEHSN